jgi:hypothetical protein
MERQIARSLRFMDRIYVGQPHPRDQTVQIAAQGSQSRFAFARNSPAIASGGAFRQVLAMAGVTADTPATVLYDGDAGLWRLQREALPNATVVLDWWHAAVRFEHALRAARGLGVADTHLAADAVCGVERAKWRLWHGRWPGCRRKVAALCRWARRTSIRGKPGIRRLEHHVGELLAYLERNQGALVHYAARRRSGELISTAFVESAVNEIIAKRMNKKQQMRWNRATVQPFLDVRTAVLSDTLRGRILSSLSRLPPRKRRGSRHIGGVMNPRIACSPAYQENMPVDLSRLYSGRARAPGSVTPRAMSARLAARGQRS